jgi:hypothetical protein
MQVDAKNQQKELQGGRQQGANSEVNINISTQKQKAESCFYPHALQTSRRWPAQPWEITFGEVARFTSQ